MVKGLYTAYTGMLNEQHRMDTLANNMANVTTAGYKKEGSTSQAFDQVLSLKIKDSTTGYNLAQKEGYVSRGVKIGENYTDWSQGSFKITENPYDLAISGNGFFTVEVTSKTGETSTLYTRDGQFTLNKEGYLVTEDGDFALDTNGNHIQLNPNLDTKIDASGIIYQDGVQVSQLQIADFEDYNYLMKHGENYYYALDGANRIAATGDIYSGYVEQSNVQSVQEMVDLITISRQYETNQKILQTIDSSLDVAVNQLGKV